MEPQYSQEIDIISLTKQNNAMHAQSGKNPPYIKAHRIASEVLHMRTETTSTRFDFETTEYVIKGKQRENETVAQGQLETSSLITLSLASCCKIYNSTTTSWMNYRSRD